MACGTYEAEDGRFTLYWVWDSPTAKGTLGVVEDKQELYTTCMDVNIYS